MTELRKQALITGSVKRIGKSISLFLADLGYDLLLHYNNSHEDAEQLQQQLSEKYPNQHFQHFRFDFNNWENVGEIFVKNKKIFNQLSLLINSASIYKQVSFKQTESEQLMQNFAIHLFAPYMLIKEFSNRFKKGSVINIIDSAINHNYTTHMPYILSKKSLADLTLLTALELAPDIRVNGISPGPVLPVEGDFEGRFEKVVQQSPLKRASSLGDLSNCIKFFIDNDSVTGQIINIDSGNHLGNKKMI
ncbi:MAG: SDR family oxidoreductase [Marinilabiliaceae bacterium]|nr:SDR family oxidoreductase [Marinilabiliaceae bacterium]